MVYNGTGAEQAVKAACMVEVTDPALTVYSVIFDTNGGGGLADYLAFQTGGPGHVFVFPETPSRPGYYFEGWNDKQDGTGNYYGTDSALTAWERNGGSDPVCSMDLSEGRPVGGGRAGSGIYRQQAASQGHGL